MDKTVMGMRKDEIGMNADKKSSLRYSSEDEMFADMKRHEELELSQAQFAALLGVNLHSVNHWECGQTSPREAQKRRIAAVRDMGKRELRKLFEEKSVPLPVLLKSGKCPF